jgi:hypothetical protein
VIISCLEGINEDFQPSELVRQIGNKTNTGKISEIFENELRYCGKCPDQLFNGFLSKSFENVHRCDIAALSRTLLSFHGKDSISVF